MDKQPCDSMYAKYDKQYEGCVKFQVHLFSPFPSKFLGCQKPPSHSTNTKYLFHDLLVLSKEFWEQKDRNYLKYSDKNI